MGGKDRERKKEIERENRGEGGMARNGKRAGLTRFICRSHASPANAGDGLRRVSLGWAAGRSVTAVFSPTLVPSGGPHDAVRTPRSYPISPTPPFLGRPSSNTPPPLYSAAGRPCSLIILSCCFSSRTVLFSLN